jgi:hypothetical protein
MRDSPEDVESVEKASDGGGRRRDASESEEGESGK